MAHAIARATAWRDRKIKAVNFSLLRRTALAASMSLGLLVGVGVARGQDAVEANREDTARAYLLYEQTLKDHPPRGDERIRHGQQIDWVGSLVWRQRWQEATARLDDLTTRLLPDKFDTAAHRAARATDVQFDPPIAIAGQNTPVRLTMSPLYPSPWARLDVRVGPVGGKMQSIGQIDSSGGELTWTPPREAGRFAVEIAPADENQGWLRESICVVEEPPSKLRDALLDRLNTIEPGDDAALAADVASTRARLQKLLVDDPGGDDSAVFLADLPALMKSLPADVAALKRGENPYLDRPGDYWRTFDLTSPPMSMPGRVYVSPKALDRLNDGQRVPLIIALHGLGGDENMFMDGYGGGLLKELADRQGFLLVSPLTYTALGDTRSFSAIVDAMNRSYDVDLDRVYAMGHSLGAITASGWAQQHSQSIAGIALLAGGNADLPVPTYVAAARFDRIFSASNLLAGLGRTRDRGLATQYELFPESAHVSVVADALPEAVGFLLKQRREPAD